MKKVIPTPLALQMRPPQCSRDAVSEYRLIAAIYHEGEEALRGHYITDTRVEKDAWVRFDDAAVYRVGPSEIVAPVLRRLTPQGAKKTAYVLFYERL